MSNSGILIVLSGLSGAGKGTIVNRLIEKHPGEYVLSISATTRGPRDGETDGKEYFFKTEEEFRSMIGKGELLEHARYVNNYYGTPKKWVMEQFFLSPFNALVYDISAFSTALFQSVPQFFKTRGIYENKN